MKTILKTLSSLLLFAAISGCDNSADPLPIPIEYTVYTTKGSPTLIYGQAVFNSVYEQGAVFRIVTNPSFGTASVKNNGQYNNRGLYFYYEPDLQASKNDDRFLVEMVSAQGKRLAIASLQITSATGCERGSLITYVRMQKNSTYTLDLLDNDLFCNINWEDAAVYSRASKNASGDHPLSLGESGSTHVATFAYTPDPNFTGVSEFYYDLGINPNPKIENWDDYMRTNWYNNREIFEKYVSVKLVVEVVE